MLFGNYVLIKQNFLKQSQLISDQSAIKSTLQKYVFKINFKRRLASKKMQIW